MTMQTIDTTAAGLVAEARAASAKDVEAVKAFDERQFGHGCGKSLAYLEAVSVTALDEALAAEEAIVSYQSRSLGDLHAKLAYLNEYGRGCAYDDYCERLVKSALADLSRLCGWGA